jgi:glycosyltransferase involved in cell wall biosynthesis
MNIAILHYAYPPVIGGVEFVMEQHARLFVRNGHSIRIVAGKGESKDAAIPITRIPELFPGHPACIAAQADTNSAAFTELKEKLKAKLRAALEGADTVIVHNMMTMHFNLAATVALAELAEEATDQHFINWIHDLAAINPDYALGRKLDVYPWDLLTEKLPGFQDIVISQNRQRQFGKLTGAPGRDCSVIPNGVEYLKLLKLTRPVRHLIRQHGILASDFIFIHPTRILARKNIEMGIRVTAELKKLGHRVFYMVTGAPDPHNAATHEYGLELKALIAELEVERDFIFVSETFKVSDNDLIALYGISDALFLPSKQEGFGLPLIEAGLFRLPVFCAGIEPMKSIITHNVTHFDLDTDPATLAKTVANTLNTNPGHRARKEVMNTYSWEKLYREKIQPICLNEG